MWDLRRRFGESQCEHAEFVIGFAFGRIESAHDAELSAIASRRQAVDFGFCTDRENVFIEIDIDGIRIDTWHVDIQYIFIFRFFDIDGRLKFNAFHFDIGFILFLFAIVIDDD